MVLSFPHYNFIIRSGDTNFDRRSEQQLQRCFKVHGIENN